MESIVVALLMLVNNEIKEARIQPNLSTCLAGKRKANRDVSNNVEYRFASSISCRLYIFFIKPNQLSSFKFS